MKPFHAFLLLGLLCLSAACSKNDPELEIEIDFTSIEITKFGNGTRQVDFTILVNQVGNIYLDQFHFKFTEYGYTKTLDEFSATLPTAREFVHRSIQLAEGGDFLAKLEVKHGNKMVSMDKRIIIP